MDGLIGASAEALRLLFTGDREIWEIVAISFSVSFRAILYIVPLAILSAFALAYGNFPGRRALITVVNSLVALPAVVVGLLLYMLLSSSGPFGGVATIIYSGCYDHWADDFGFSAAGCHDSHIAARC